MAKEKDRFYKMKQLEKQLKKHLYNEKMRLKITHKISLLRAQLKAR